jgi:hypothetical protein
LKKLLLFLVLIFLPIAAPAAEPLEERPHWSFEAKGGNFAPALADWKQFYGKRSMPEYEFALSYKLLRQVEVGVEGGFAEARGQAYAQLHSQQAGSPVLAGRVTYDLYPVNVFVLLRGLVSENQWLVPYVGGGFTRMYYQEKVEGQGTTRGSADGYHYRGGLQFLLDGLDRDAANSMYLDSGVYHTYFFVEAEKTNAKVKSVSVNLGGTAYLMGLLFEY